jgi:SNF2 family DNA or RNA helicase
MGLCLVERQLLTNCVPFFFVLSLLCVSLQYHGPKRPQDPRDLIDYDVVLSAYSILSIESSQIGARSKAAALNAPWEFEGPSGLSYTSPLSQVHWRRIILDEGHSVKNQAAECSQQANKLLGRCRWLMVRPACLSSLVPVSRSCHRL